VSETGSAFWEMVFHDMKLTSPTIITFNDPLAVPVEEGAEIYTKMKASWKREDFVTYISTISTAFCNIYLERWLVSCNRISCFFLRHGCHPIAFCIVMHHRL
jgi:hypothetical protein